MYSCAASSVILNPELALQLLTTKMEDVLSPQTLPLFRSLLQTHAPSPAPPVDPYDPDIMTDQCVVAVTATFGGGSGITIFGLCETIVFIFTMCILLLVVNRLYQKNYDYHMAPIKYFRDTSELSGSVERQKEVGYNCLLLFV